MATYFLHLSEEGKILHYGELLGLSSAMNYQVEDWATGEVKAGLLSKDEGPRIHLYNSTKELNEALAALVAGLGLEEAIAGVIPVPQPKKPAFVVAVTGHRPNKLGGYDTPNPLYDLVVKGLVEAFEKLKPEFVISGMAIGVDQWAAEICINMKIPFVAALPFAGQEGKWPPKSQAKYHWILSQAYARYTICDGGYEPWKMQKRNDWMMESCHQVVAVWNGTPGGTANCLGSAAKLGKPIYYVPIPPAGMEVGEYFEKTYGAQPQQQQKQEAPSVPGTKRIVEI